MADNAEKTHPRRVKSLSLARHFLSCFNLERTICGKRSWIRLKRCCLFAATLYLNPREDGERENSVGLRLFLLFCGVNLRRRLTFCDVATDRRRPFLQMSERMEFQFSATLPKESGAVTVAAEVGRDLPPFLRLRRRHHETEVEEQQPYAD